jgi:hypothetical protein
MPWLDHGIFFVAAKEDPRIKSGGDERGRSQIACFPIQVTIPVTVQFIATRQFKQRRGGDGALECTVTEMTAVF